MARPFRPPGSKFIVFRLLVVGPLEHRHQAFQDIRFTFGQRLDSLLREIIAQYVFWIFTIHPGAAIGIRHAIAPQPFAIAFKPRNQAFTWRRRQGIVGIERTGNGCHRRTWPRQALGTCASMGLAYISLSLKRPSSAGSNFSLSSLNHLGWTKSAVPTT